MSDTRKYLLFILVSVLLGICLTSCSVFVRPTIIFPLEGAELNNPVYVEAEGVVNWYVDGVFVDRAKSWRGWLSEGKHEVKGATYSAIHINVLEDFPLGQVRSFNAAEAPYVKLPNEGDLPLF